MFPSWDCGLVIPVTFPERLQQFHRLHCSTQPIIHHRTLNNHQYYILCGLTVGPRLLGGRGKGGLEDLRLTTPPMAEISLSNMALTVLVWTRVRRGDSLACIHVRTYCKRVGTGTLFRRFLNAFTNFFYHGTNDHFPLF